MPRLLSRLAWLLVLAGLAIALYQFTPLGRLPLLIRLWTQELQAPLHMPVQGVRATALADTWGASRSQGRTHEGIDIFARC
ncbi:MAG: M23 family peptidase, partial [Comamonadaceae bacterium]